MALLKLDDTVRDFLQREYLGNSYQRWLIAALVLVGGFVLLGIIKRLLVARLATLAERTETDIDDLLVDLVRRTKRFFLFLIALYLAHQTLDWTAARGTESAIHSMVETLIRDGAKVGLWLQVGFWGLGLVQFGVHRLVRGQRGTDPSRTMGVSILGYLGKLLVWSIVLLTCLEALGAPVTSLIASLGVGGIAVALALQNVLGDLFASIAILLDKPFVVGDSIQVGDFNGTIERIGIKTTRLRSINGEEIVMGNNDLLSSRIRNFKRLAERRIVLLLGADYATPPETVARIPVILREIIEATPGTRFDRAHFKGFGDWALQFEAVYFSVNSEYGPMMDAQQAVDLAVLKRFEAEDIQFAFPTQVVRNVDGNGRDTSAPQPDLRAEAILVQRQLGKGVKGQEAPGKSGP